MGEVFESKGKYAKCDRCGSAIVPVYFRERERKVINGAMVYTGRTREACSHLECVGCMKEFPVDDTFDRPWEG